MLNELLKEKLRIIQGDYKELLSKLITKLNSPEYLIVIDEINIFWYLRRKIINLILENISIEQDCYALMAASYLDVIDNEHFPFICFGQTHIIDDTLCHFAKIAQYGNDIILSEKMKNQITLAMQDNTTVLENFSDIITILPITLLYTDKEHNELVCKASMQFISSIFKVDFNSKVDFIEKFNTFQDIINAIPNDIQKHLIFTDYEDNMLDFDKKIERYIDENKQFIPKEVSKSEIFFYMIFQYIVQAFDIILKCAQFNIVPYIRFDVAYQYILIISSNFEKIPQLQKILFKTIHAHVLYQLFDKDRIDKIDFTVFSNKIKEYHFEDKVANDIQIHNLDFNKGNLDSLMKIISSHLEKIYDENQNYFYTL